MRPAELETWILSIADRVKNGQVVEDSRVELKRDWPDVAKAARRIAGHANASHGDPVLWIIGLDEAAGPVGLAARDMSEWLPSVLGWFEGVAPSVTDLAVSHSGHTLVGLLFTTDRAPYVVRNSAYGKSGEAVSLEVPWREATKVRSARRDELLRLLVVNSRTPAVEILDATLHIQSPKDAAGDEGGPRWNARIHVYLTPRAPGRLVVPVHRSTLIIGIDRDRWPAAADSFDFIIPSVARSMHDLFGQNPPFPPTKDSVTLHATATELVADGPGAFKIECRGPVPDRAWHDAFRAECTLELWPVDVDRPARVTIMLVRSGSDERGIYLTIESPPALPE